MAYKFLLFALKRIGKSCKLQPRRVGTSVCLRQICDAPGAPAFPSEHHFIDAHETEFLLRLSALFTMSCILDLSDELLVMICQYTLCPVQCLIFTGKPSSGLGKYNIRHEYQKSIAAGLFFTNHQLSCIAISIVYGEDTFCFITELRAIIEFFRSLPLKNLKQIKRIYLPHRLQRHAERSIDGPLLSSATTFLHQRMSLESFSIAVPQCIEVEINKGSFYPHSNHGRLPLTANGSHFNTPPATIYKLLM